MAASVEQLEVALKDLDLWHVACDLLSFGVEVIELDVELCGRLFVVAVLHLFLDEFDFIEDVFVEVFHVHFHAYDLCEAELSADHALVLISLNLLNLSVDLREHLLEWRWVIHLRVVGLVGALQDDGLAGAAGVGQQEHCSHRDHIKNRLHFSIIIKILKSSFHNEKFI